MNEALIICVGCLSVAFVWARQRRMKAHVLDLQFLRAGLSDLIRHDQLKRPLSLQTPLGRGIWTAVVALNKQRDVSSETGSLEELVQITAPITAASDDIAQTGEEVLRLLHARLGGLVVGTAILWPEGSKLHVLCISGVPRSRLEVPLLMSIESLLHEDPSHGGLALGSARSGYQMPVYGGAFDFSCFGVGTSFISALKSLDSTSHGVLWLGLRDGLNTLSTENKALISALAEHAGAAFYAAQKVKARTEHSEQSRDFLIGMSHDIRAPGNSALYAIRALLHGELGVLSAEQHLTLKTVEQAIQEQLGLVGDALDFAKHQRGCLTARRSAVSVAEVLVATCDPFMLAASSCSIRLAIECDPDLQVLFDPAHLRRIMTNLISNAFKYTEQGTVTVRTVTEAKIVRIEVQDTGIGVPPNEKQSLFREFKRLNNSSTREGVGLGLALVRALAELNEASAFYEPAPGQGSIFGIIAERSCGANTYAPKVGGVIVVDDDSAACRAHMRNLRDLSDQLVPASSVSEALELSLRLKPDLLVTDYQIGCATASDLLNELERTQNSVPTIILTGDPDLTALRRKNFGQGVVILAKPASRRDLQEAVRSVLSVDTATARQVCRS